MKVINTPLEGCLIIEPDVFGDDRGFFLETYQSDRYKKDAGIDFNFVQDNHSRSSFGILRGLHFQKTKPQGKLVRVVTGEVFDVVVDIRKQSKTFGKWTGITINDSNKKQLWVPPGFAHGFQVLSEYADFEYKCTDYYDPDDEGIIHWNDPTLNISWPINDPVVSKKDSQAPFLSDIKL